jgi:adenylate kinase
MLDEALALVGAKVDLALSLEAPVEKLVSRFEKRWGCTNCGGVFAFELAPAGGATCARCGMAGTLVRRADDAPDAVRYRFGIFESATAPVVSAYLERGLLERLDGLAEREEVHAELVAKIMKIFPLAGC